MNVELGMEVLSRDGEPLGRASRVIMDPRTLTVGSVAIEHGFLLREAVEAPASSLDSDREGRLVLAMTAEEAEGLPRYDESRYADASSDPAAPFGVPTTGIVWQAASPSEPPFGGGIYPASLLSTAEAETPPVSDDEAAIAAELDSTHAVLDDGSDVISRDGDKVGEVHGIRFDAASGRPEALRVRQGFLFAHDVDVPAGAISSVDDGVVYLKADREQLHLWSRDETVLLF